MESTTESRADYLTRIKPKGERAMSRSTIGVNLPMELDAYVRSLPNRAEWLREAIAEKWQRDQQNRET